MNNKAFTLIELLAVIVILAIISLIATPIVLNIINDSKKSSNEESIKMYGKAIENAAGNYFLKHPYSKTVTVQNLKDENLINYDGSQVECKIEKIYKSGKIYLKDCTVGGTKVDYTYGEESYKDYIHLIEDTEPIGLSPGDKYTYDVNDNNTFTFYVLSIEENQVNLIMDRNICGSAIDPNDSNNGKPATKENKCLIAWYSKKMDTSYDPITAMQALYNATKEWLNVPNLDLSGDNRYKDNEYTLSDGWGYGTIETIDDGVKITRKNGTEVTQEDGNTPDIPYEENKPLKARLPKYIEVTSAVTKCTNIPSSCAFWLVNNLSSNEDYYSNIEFISGIGGYWLLSSNGDLYGHVARAIYFTGTLSGYLTDIACYGIRPVITVPMSNF